MSSHSDDKAVEKMMWVMFVLLLLYAIIVASVILIATIALFIIGWYLTHLLIVGLDDATEGNLAAEHGGLLLIISGFLWAGLAWLLVPAYWLHVLAGIIPAIAGYPYLAPTVGGILGLTWGALVLFVADREAEADLLNASGMYTLTDKGLQAGEPDMIDRLTEGVMLGTDVDY